MNVQMWAGNMCSHSRRHNRNIIYTLLPLLEIFRPAQDWGMVLSGRHLPSLPGAPEICAGFAERQFCPRSTTIPPCAAFSPPLIIPGT